MISTNKTELNNKLELHNTDKTAHQPILDMISTNKTELNNKLELHNTDKTAHQPILDMIKGNQTEVNNKIELHNTDLTAHSDIRQIFNSYLPLTGGTVTGTLNVSTQIITDTSTKVANTAFVQSVVDNKVSQLVNSAPETLDTLNELSNALGNDPNFATTVADMIGQKADSTALTSYVPLAGATMTGELIVPTLKITQSTIKFADDTVLTIE